VLHSNILFDATRTALDGFRRNVKRETQAPPYVYFSGLVCMEIYNGLISREEKNACNVSRSNVRGQQLSKRICFLDYSLSCLLFWISYVAVKFFHFCFCSVCVTDAI